jgi:serine/threonine protein kinase
MASQVFQLIQDLLNVDPKKRPSLDQVLGHPFINKPAQREERIQLNLSKTGEFSILYPSTLLCT